MSIENQRSPARITQYAPYIRRAMGFCTDNNFYSDNAKCVLNEHYKKNISTRRAIHELKVITKLADIEDSMSFLLYKPRFELHPVNRCNYHCDYCAYYEMYESDEIDNCYIKFENIENVKLFNPKAILLSGGYCEPGLYYDKEQKADINDLIAKLSKDHPSAQIGMNSNGSVNISKGFSNLNWLRISLDAATDSTLALLKGTSFSVKQILDNCKDYLINANEKQSLGFGFLYHNRNINEITDFIELIYQNFKDCRNFNIINIHFRPLRPLINERIEIAETQEYSLAYDNEEMKKIQNNVEQLVKTDNKLGIFIKNQTNISDIYQRYVNGNFSFENYNFPEKCFIPFVTMIVGPSGCCYACLTNIQIGRFDLEKRIILADFNKINEKEERLKLCLNTIYASMRVMDCCNKIECDHGDLLDYHDAIFSTEENTNHFDSYFF